MKTHHALLATLLCAAGACAAARIDLQVQDADGKPLAGAVAFVESAASRAAAKPVLGVEVEQADKQFTQRVSVVTVGSQILFPNRDKVRHHVYSFSMAKTFEIKLYTGVPANPVLFDRAGVVVLGCNIHDTMVAWVLVVETPWHGQTNALGQLRLPEVPAGTHMLRVWHPDLPPGTAPVEQALMVSGDSSAVVRLAGVAGVR
jgi:plastocyanin